MSETLPLDIDHARQTMADWPVGHTLLYTPRVASTMIPARRALETPEYASGVVCVTEEQSAGKGRLARSWEAPFGTGLLSTTVLKAPNLPAPLGLAPMLAGVAVTGAIAELAPDLRTQLALKWPNDVLITGESGAEKVAGILAESSLRAQTLTGVLLGIGINVNQSVEQLPEPSAGMLAPTSICLATGCTIDRTALLIALCHHLGAWLTAACTGGSALFVRWRTLLHTLGQDVIVSQPDGTRVAAGVAVDVLRDGSLVIEQADGVQTTIAAGDVTLRQ